MTRPTAHGDAAGHAWSCIPSTAAAMVDQAGNPTVRICGPVVTSCSTSRPSTMTRPTAHGDAALVDDAMALELHALDGRGCRSTRPAAAVDRPGGFGDKTAGCLQAHGRDCGNARRAHPSSRSGLPAMIDRFASTAAAVRICGPVVTTGVLTLDDRRRAAPRRDR